jgi:PBP1b-binding outer membrane lipoprotein LpoB
MLYRLCAITIVALAAVMLGGCKKEAEPAPAPAVQQAEQTAPPVTAENLDSELDKMEAEVDADIAAEQ